MVYFFEGLIMKPILYNFLIKEVVGKENLPKDKAMIIAANHNSHLDEFVVMPPVVYTTKRRARFFADRQHWHEGKLVFRLIAKYFKSIPVDRGKGKGDEALKKGLRELENGNSIIIYPEGTRGNAFDLGRGKVGVAKLALRSGMPVVPCGVYGTQYLMPKGTHKIKMKKIVSVKFGKPMTFDGDAEGENNPEELRKITDMIMSRIGTLIDQEYNPEVTDEFHSSSPSSPQPGN